MLKIYAETDEKICRDLWQRTFPKEHLADLWKFRACFQIVYNRDLFFIVAEESGQITGLFPLSWIKEKGYYGYFPGEVWEGKTWIEQNRLFAKDQSTFQKILQWLNDLNKPYHIRYLVHPEFLGDNSLTIDEIGYLFFPSHYDENMDNYYSVFNRRSIKSIKKEVARLENQGLKVEESNPSDFDLIIDMNISKFKELSYFSDQRFTQSFRNVVHFLDQNNWLKIIKMTIENEPVAVDLGCLYNNQYTLLAGGTNSHFPGIAKAINLFHLSKSCANRYQHADFLCGDFHWKKMFHLHPRPLYKITNFDQETP